MLTVSLVPDNGFDGWERFVAHSKAGPLHLAAWNRILRESFSVKPMFLQAQCNDGTIAGVLPLYLSRSAIKGRHLASLDGGIFASDAACAAALLAEAISLRRKLSARYLVLRDAPKEEAPGATRTMMVRRVVSTSAGVKALWKSLKSDTRKEIRRGERAGYTIRCSPDTQSLRDFYKVFAGRMHQLGTPVVSERLFAAMRAHLGTAFSLFIVEKTGEVCGGLIAVAGSTRASALYAAVERRHMNAYANYLMYWRVIEHFAAAGMPSLDFGTNAVGSPVSDFKSSWPAEVESVAYDVYADSDRTAPKNLRTADDKSFPQRLWQRLPLATANLLGPLIRAQLPFG